MDYIKFNIEACNDCYSCLRHCPVKSIKFVDNRATIISNQCVLCGNCINVCPQNAKKVISSLQQVKNIVRENPGKVALSVAPSFITNFDVPNFETLQAACLKLGFAVVEETARGAHYVTEEYRKIVQSKKQKVILTTACPAAVDFVRLNYPNAIKYLVPVCTPMIAHAEIIKKDYGSDMHVIFVGPCIAKKKEAVEARTLDCALSYDELLEWLKEENIELTPVESNGTSFDIARYYPIHRGIIKSFGQIDNTYELMSVDGVEEIKDVIENIDAMENMFIEMNMCVGGCINGPLRLSKRPQMKDQLHVREFARNSKATYNYKEYDSKIFYAEYTPLKNDKIIPSESEIREILAKMNKYSKSDELNCGACGYNTCRDKAIAVFNGFSDAEFCLPYLKNKAESISNEIIQHTPNGILTVNDMGILIDVNERCDYYLQMDKSSIGHHFTEYIDLPELMEALETGENVNSLVAYNEKNNMYFDVSITAVKEHGVAFAIYKDITEVVLNDEKMKALREEMINVTDQVINKQMAAVQEIASLLGESTAEAKVALINFKKSLKEENK